MGNAAACKRGNRSATIIEQGAIGGSEPLFIKSSECMCSTYRRLLRDVVSSVLMEYGLVHAVERAEEEEDELLADLEIEKIRKIVFAEVYLSICHWKDFFRRNYGEICTSEREYIMRMFRVLRHIHARRGWDFFDNLLSGIAFVVLSTAYFCHNWMDEVLKHPIRILATYFEHSETGFYADFRSAGGFKDLAEHCSERSRMLWAYHQMQLEFYRRSQVAYRCLWNQTEEACEALKTSVEESFMLELDGYTDLEFDLIEKALRNHSDSNLRKKRKLDNLFIFQDHHFPTSIIQSIEKEDCGARKRDKPQAEVKKSSFRPPLVDTEVVEKIESSLSEVNSRLCELHKMADLTLE